VSNDGVDVRIAIGFHLWKWRVINCNHHTEWSVHFVSYFTKISYPPILQKIIYWLSDVEAYKLLQYRLPQSPCSDSCHITAPYWLPVRRRVDFKIAVLVNFQCLTGQARGYLAEDCQLVADVSARRLQSADTATCVMHRTSNIFGDRCFAAAGPRLWNSLPINLRQCQSLEQFKRLLKTFLFSA